MMRGRELGFLTTWQKLLHFTKFTSCSQKHLNSCNNISSLKNWENNIIVSTIICYLDIASTRNYSTCFNNNAKNKNMITGLYKILLSFILNSIKLVLSTKNTNKTKATRLLKSP